MATKNQHVVPRDGRWGVRSAGATRVAKTFDTQREAISHGTAAAQKHGSELYIHGEDGRIRERNSYGRDPHPPKG